MGPRTPPASAASSLALTRAQRIRKRPEFVRIQDSSARVSTRNLLLLLDARSIPGLAAGDSASAPPRLGVVASRKVGNAVARNRCKRLVREAFRALQHAIPRGVDVVVIVRPGTNLLAASDVRAQIEQALPQLARRAREVLSRRAGR